MPNSPSEPENVAGNATFSPSPPKPRRPPESNLILRARRSPRSLRAAISAMCFSCQGGDEEHAPDPGWKRAIRECMMRECPLHPWRPYQRGRA